MVSNVLLVDVLGSICCWPRDVFDLSCHFAEPWKIRCECCFVLSENGCSIFICMCVCLCGPTCCVSSHIYFVCSCPAYQALYLKIERKQFDSLWTTHTYNNLKKLLTMTFALISHLWYGCVYKRSVNVKRLRSQRWKKPQAVLFLVYAYTSSLVWTHITHASLTDPAANLLNQFQFPLSAVNITSTLHWNHWADLVNVAFLWLEPSHFRYS